MANHQNGSTNGVGFCLLPSELIQNILLYLALPEIVRMKLVNKSISCIISDQSFVRECNSRSRSATWLFVCKKRWRRDLILHGFSDQSDRWFKIPIADLLKPVIFPGEDIYFLTASGNVFLFVSNTRQEVFAVNLVSKTVKRIPPSPLGPRGTSLWRRSAMKLVSGWDDFRFLFAELVENRPVLFEYQSETDRWRSTEAKQIFNDLPRGKQGNGDCVFLNVMNGPNESTVIATELHSKAPVIARPRFDWGGNERQQSTVGLGASRPMNRLHVYGDGYMMIVKSDTIDDDDDDVMNGGGMSVLKEIEMWGLSNDGRQWDYMCRVPREVMEEIKKKQFGVIMGCLEGRKEIIRGVLVSNLEGKWDIIWVCYDISNNEWSLVQVPDCNAKGSNMAGISFSSGLTLLQ